MGDSQGCWGLLQAPRKHGQGLPVCPSPGGRLPRHLVTCGEEDGGRRRSFLARGLGWHGDPNTQYQKGLLRSCGLMQVPQRSPFIWGQWCCW